MRRFRRPRELENFQDEVVFGSRAFIDMDRVVDVFRQVDLLLTVRDDLASR